MKFRDIITEMKEKAQLLRLNKTALEVAFPDGNWSSIDRQANEYLEAAVILEERTNG